MASSIHTFAKIFYIDQQGNETVRQEFGGSSIYDYLQLANEMRKTVTVTKVQITEMYYTTPAGHNYQAIRYWYEPSENDFVLTKKYEL